MLDVTTASREDLEFAVLENDDLAAFLGGLNAITPMSDPELREKISDWVAAGDETAGCTNQ